MGVVILGINGGFFSNSPLPLQNSPISGLQIVQIASDFTASKKSSNFDGRKSRFGRLGTGVSVDFVRKKKSWAFDGRSTKICASEGHSVEIIEKELKFSPMFNDYVKVMESVRTDRSKNLSEDAGEVSAKKRSMREVATSRVEEKIDSGGGKGTDGNYRRRDNGEKRQSGWGLVERIMEKRTSRRSLNDSKDVSKRILHLERGESGLQNGRGVRNRPKEVSSGSGDRFTETTRYKSRSLQLYVKHLNGSDSGRVGFGRKNIDQSKDEEKHIDRLYTRKISPERRDQTGKRSVAKSDQIGNRTVMKSDESLVTRRTLYESGRFGEVDTSKKRNGPESSKAIWAEDEMSIMNNRKTRISLHRNETDKFEKVSHGTSQRHAKLYLHRNETDKFEKVSHGTSQRHAKLYDNGKETKSLDFRGNEMRKWSKGEIQSEKVSGRVSHEKEFEERAAFQTFETFTDVRNRPRVLRMELEEKIQKLAKWLNATDVNMPEWQFSKIMHSANIKFTEHSILRVVQVLGALGNWKRCLQVVEWLQSRERFKAYKSRYIYTSVIDVLGKAKRPVEALNVFYAMRQELSSYPDLAAYHCIAVALGQAGLMKELFDIIDCMRAVPEKKFNLGPLQRWDPRLEPDLVVYNAVLNACVQQKQWEGAFWVLQQFKEQNLQPTNTTYGLIMEAMLASEKYNLVHEVFKKVENTSIPNALNYKVLVNTLWREGRTDKAVQAVKDMERRGIVGSANLYYDLARCLCSAGRCKEALQQINKICKVAKKPLVVTYTGLIQACLDAKNIGNATYIFNQMHKYCSPNIVTCNIMLKSYIKHGMYNEAKDLFWKVVDGSHQIRSKVDSNQKFVPDKFTFNTMMDACASTNNWDDFESTYKQMLHHGFHFDNKRHLRMILDASRAGKRQVMEETWDHLVCFGRALPPPMIQEKFCILLQDEDHLAAISLVKVHSDNNIQAFTKNSWLNLLKSNLHRIKKETIRRLAHELRNLVSNTEQPRPVYENLLDACRYVR